LEQHLQAQLLFSEHTWSPALFHHVHLSLKIKMMFSKLLGKADQSEPPSANEVPASAEKTDVSEKAQTTTNARPALWRQNSVQSMRLAPDGEPGKHKFVSYKLKGEYQQPWRDHPRLNRTKINNRIVYGFIVLGFALAALICFMNIRTVQKHPYCLVYEDDFQTLDTNVWTHEVQIDGYGTGSFDWTTTDPKNSFVDSEGLHIVPTLTNETTEINNDQIYNGYTLNLTSDGTCSSTSLSSCAIESNSTKGTMIPPVRSARLVTRGKKSIRYGKVEVTAQLPEGNWLWPAIWMMPENSTYGTWPKSGEIDIMESRGNAPGYSAGGRDVYTSTLHWGLDFITDAFWRTTAGRVLRRTDYSKSFNTFGMEWTEDYIVTYLNSRIVQVLFTGFKKDSSLWDLGNFQGQVSHLSC
jgi:hypothetical protein